MSEHFVFFHDEAKAVYPGFRRIYVKSLGRKWAHLHEMGTETNFKLPVATWTAMRDGSNSRLTEGGIAVIQVKKRIRFKPTTPTVSTRRGRR